MSGDLKPINMKWIDKNERMPKNDPEFDWTTKSVIVTDGKNWGHGWYDHHAETWTYNMTGMVQQEDDSITHWAEPLELPA